MKGGEPLLSSTGSLILTVSVMDSGELLLPDVQYVPFLAFRPLTQFTCVV